MPVQADEFQVEYVMLDADLKDVEKFEPTAIQFKYISPVGPNTDILGVFAIGLSDDEVEEFDPVFGPVSLSVDLATLFGVYVRGSTDMGANARLYGQLGLVQLKYDLDAEIVGLSGSESYDDIGLAYGFGIAFGASDRVALTIEYNVLPDVDFEDLTEFETTAFSIGFQMSF